MGDIYRNGRNFTISERCYKILIKKAVSKVDYTITGISVLSSSM